MQLHGFIWSDNQQDQYCWILYNLYCIMYNESWLNLCSIWCLSVWCHVLCYQVPHLNIWDKWSQIFMKISAYFRIGLLSWLIIFVSVHIPMWVHEQLVKTWTLLLCLFVLEKFQYRHKSVNTNTKLSILTQNCQ